MIKIKSLVKSVKCGVGEITGKGDHSYGDMTFGEKLTVAGGVGAAIGGAIDIGIGALITGKNAVIIASVGKFYLVGGTVVAGGALGKAFLRGFVWQLKTELNQE